MDSDSLSPHSYGTRCSRARPEAGDLYVAKVRILGIIAYPLTTTFTFKGPSPSLWALLPRSRFISEASNTKKWGLISWYCVSRLVGPGSDLTRRGQGSELEFPVK